MVLKYTGKKTTLHLDATSEPVNYTAPYLWSLDPDIPVVIDNHKEAIHWMLLGSMLDYIYDHFNDVTYITGNAGTGVLPMSDRDNVTIINKPFTFFKHGVSARWHNHAFKGLTPWNHFICMNNRGHEHRLYFLDKLYEEGLQHYAFISWLSPFQLYKYEPTCFNPRTKLVIDCPPPNQNHCLDAQWDIPIQYHHAAIDIVTESLHNLPKGDAFITEKTVRPLLLKKPFIAVASADHHMWLRDNGFELYEELFDYSFDTKRSFQSRVEGVIENIKTIAGIYVHDLNIEGLDDKLEHNYNRALELAK